MNIGIQRDCDTLQAAAFVECINAYACYGVWDNYTSEVIATVECIVADRTHRVASEDGRNSDIARH